jgi:hypothetical protein
MSRERTAWRDAFADALGREDMAGMVAALRERATAHAGTPPGAIKEQALRLIERRLRTDPDARLRIGLALASSGDDGAKEVALGVLAPLYTQAPEAVSRTLLALADDASWEVREWAAGAISAIVPEAFDAFYPTLRAWAAHRSPNVRRAVAVGAGGAARQCDAACCARLLDLLEPLLADPDSYVGRNLGAFAIGDGLLRAQPELVAEWLERVSWQEQPRVRWNVAQALSSAAAGSRAALLLPALAVLATDERPEVRDAVTTAAASLAKRAPEVVLPLLESWRSDPLRAPVAARALADGRA